MEQVSWPWPRWDPAAVTGPPDRFAGARLPAAVSGLPPTRQRVVVLSGDPAVGVLLTEDLTQAGHEVRLTASPVEAFKALAAGWVDAVVSDTTTARRVGSELVELIRSNRPGVAVLFLTAEITSQVGLGAPVGPVGAAGGEVMDGSGGELTAAAEAARRLRSLLEFAADRDRRPAVRRRFRLPSHPGRSITTNPPGRSPLTGVIRFAGTAAVGAMGGVGGCGSHPPVGVAAAGGLFT